MSATIYLEGGPGPSGSDSKYLKLSHQKAFHNLLSQLNLKRQPHLVSCGSRNNAFDRFRTAVKSLGAKSGDFICLLVDSEGPVTDPQEPWAHLKSQDNWTPPAGAAEDQVLLMVTCMESWIVADRPTLNKHYGRKFQESALPPAQNLERTPPQEMHAKLRHASRNCPKPFAKGKESFEILGKLNASLLEKTLPSFARMVRILRKRL